MPGLVGTWAGGGGGSVGGTRPAYLTDQDGAGAGMLLARVQHCLYLLLAETWRWERMQRETRIESDNHAYIHLLKTSGRGLLREKDAVNSLVFLGQ